MLLLEGKPYWDTKFLVRSLSMDESVELTAVVQLAEGRLLQRKIARRGKKADDQWTIEKDAGKFLADRAALASYQIVILGRNAEVFLSDEALTRLTKWLDADDGSLVCFRGAPSSKIGQRLDELMPVRWTASAETRFRAQWTNEGQALRWLPDEGETDPLTAMPALATTTQPKIKPYVATVLATNAGGGQTVPLVTYRAGGSVGSGRVVAVEGAGMWRWAFLPPQHQDRDELYGSLWRSLVRWLVTNAGMLPSQRLALRAEKCTFNTEENAAVALQVREDRWTGGRPQIELCDAALAPLKTVPCKPWGNAAGQYHADLGPLAEGRYRVRVAGAAKDETSAEAAFERPRQPPGAARCRRAAGEHEVDRRGQRRRGVDTRRVPGTGKNVRRTHSAQPSRAGHPHAGLGPLVAPGRGLRPLGHGLGPATVVGIDLDVRTQTVNATTGLAPNGTRLGRNDLHQCQLRCDKTPASSSGR